MSSLSFESKDAFLLYSESDSYREPVYYEDCLELEQTVLWYSFELSVEISSFSYNELVVVMLFPVYSFAFLSIIVKYSGMLVQIT